MVISSYSYISTLVITVSIIVIPTSSCLREVIDISSGVVIESLACPVRDLMVVITVNIIVILREVIDSIACPGTRSHFEVVIDHSWSNSTRLDGT